MRKCKSESAREREREGERKKEGERGRERERDLGVVSDACTLFFLEMYGFMGVIVFLPVCVSVCLRVCAQTSF